MKPRYLVEASPTGMRRIVRADGLALGCGVLPPRPVLPVETPPVEPEPERLRFGPISPRLRKQIVRAARPAVADAPGGAELRARRDALGLSQRALAAEVGIARGLVCEIESGRRAHLATRARMAAALARLEGARQ